MKAIEIQARILDCLLEELQHGNKEFINLLLELTGEIPFKDLRSAVYILAELGYINHNDAIPDNKGFFCKITKEGIRYHQDIFDAKEDAPQEKTSFFDSFKNIVSFFENAKTVITTLVTIIVLVFGLNIQKVAHQFPFLANFISIEETSKTTEVTSQENKNPVQQNILPIQKNVIQDFNKNDRPLTQKVIVILGKIPEEQRKILENELKKFPLIQQEEQLRILLRKYQIPVPQTR